MGCSISGLGFFLEDVHLSSEHVLAFKLSKFLEDTLMEIHAPGAVWSPSHLLPLQKLKTPGWLPEGPTSGRQAEGVHLGCHPRAVE